MTNIADQMRGKGQGDKGFGGQRPAQNQQTGGDETALALTSAIQGQANALALAAQAADLSVQHASDQLSDYFVNVVSGQALLNATLAKTQEKLQAMGGPVQVQSEMSAISFELPKVGSYSEVRQRFLGAFTTRKELPSPFVPKTGEGAE